MMSIAHQMRTYSHYCASSSGPPNQPCQYRCTMGAFRSYRQPGLQPPFRWGYHHHHDKNATSLRSADEVSALAAEAHTQALAREREQLAELTIEELRARLLKHGYSDSSLPTLRPALVGLLAEANLQARTQVVCYPLRRTPSSPRSLKSFMVAPIDIEDVGFVNFVLDSGSSGALITGELRERLGLSPSDGQVVKGVDSSGVTLRQKVRLPPLRLGPLLLDIRDAYVTTLKSDHDIEVGGVLGLSFLRQFEVEICGSARRLAFHPYGHIEKGVLGVAGLTRLRCDVLKGGLLAVPVSLNGSERFPAILDLGANHSILNWHAAELAGFKRGGGEAGGGGGSKVLQEVTSVDGQRSNRTRKGFLDIVLGDKASPYAPNRSLALLVRDVPSFAALGFGDSPLMVLGFDVLSEERLVLDLRNTTIYVQ